MNDDYSSVDLGPAPKSSVDWFFQPRPGRSLDAAEVRLAQPRQVHPSAPSGFRGVLAHALALFTRSG